MLLQVDRDSGVIRTTRRLDREQRSTYVFTVSASNDDVTASRRHGNDVADVIVRVDDVNDNEPVFVFPGRERGDVAYISTSLASTVLSQNQSIERFLGGLSSRTTARSTGDSVLMSSK